MPQVYDFAKDNTGHMGQLNTSVPVFCFGLRPHPLRLACALVNVNVHLKYSTLPLKLETLKQSITLKCHCHVSMKFTLNILFNPGM